MRMPDSSSGIYVCILISGFRFLTYPSFGQCQA